MGCLLPILLLRGASQKVRSDFEGLLIYLLCTGNKTALVLVSVNILELQGNKADLKDLLHHK